MNTKDQAQSRHERLEWWCGHPGVLGAAVVASAATVFLGGLAGLGLAGVRRRVTRSNRETDVCGADVPFDPEPPGDEKPIFVALRRHPAPAGWLPAACVPSSTRSTS
ncbi:hypothetical protein ACIOD2_45515 [Amycolatopsis sp. NPDC088138]|uniref:hypothetical protein n=1 Tax=Amycolatopsis sp. NPDC088138 TaxID=3363938 RepID=UPI003801EF2E